MNEQPRSVNLTRRAMLGGLLAGGCSTLVGCGWDGHFTMFGYTTRPNYDMIGVELVWRDLRSGLILSNPRKPTGIPLGTELPPFDPANLPLDKARDQPIPAVLTFGGRFLPEVGESNASAQTRVCNRMAVQIIYMMEKDWQLPERPCP
ncbi:MAG: hypothetical protein K8T89_16985 [Planctomycetes bacterium]|nr:hypothetical protein [Planctomycetota bacterium]